MKRKRILAFILQTAMTLSLLLQSTPSVAVADEMLMSTTEKNITLGASALKGGQQSNVYFGNYQQSNAGTAQPAGTENVDWIKNDKAIYNSQGPYYNIDPIKWHVLSNSDGKLFLLSDQNLDLIKYHSYQTNMTWENSAIRSWLNGNEFYDFAFSLNEKSAIVKTTVVNDDNEEYNISGGNDTEDNIFLISLADVKNEEYGFKYDKDRKSVNTDYVVGGGKNGKRRYGAAGADDWWLRSPGMYRFFAANVNNYGSISPMGITVNDDGVPVRPALNLNTSDILFTSSAQNGKSKTAGLILANAENTTGEYKLTIKDNARQFAVTQKTVKGDKDETIILDYSNG